MMVSQVAIVTVVVNIAQLVGRLKSRKKDQSILFQIFFIFLFFVKKNFIKTIAYIQNGMFQNIQRLDLQ